MLHYPIVSLHVHRKLLALRELFWAKAAVKVLDPQVNLFMRPQHMLIKKGFAATIEFTFELSFCRVSHNMTLQVVLVTAPERKRSMRFFTFAAPPLSTGWADNLFCPALGLRRVA